MSEDETSKRLRHLKKHTSTATALMSLIRNTAAMPVVYICSHVSAASLVMLSDVCESHAICPDALHNVCQIIRNTRVTK